MTFKEWFDTKRNKPEFFVRQQDRQDRFTANRKFKLVAFNTWEYRGESFTLEAPADEPAKVPEQHAFLYIACYVQFAEAEGFEPGAYQDLSEAPGVA